MFSELAPQNHKQSKHRMCVVVGVAGSPFLKTTKIAERGLGSCVRQTTKLMAVTWEIL